MKIKILKDGQYSDFESEPRYRAVQRAAGEEVEYVEWYARSLVASGMAAPTGSGSEASQPAIEIAAAGPTAGMSPSGDKRKRRAGGADLSAGGVELGKASDGSALTTMDRMPINSRITAAVAETTLVTTQNLVTVTVYWGQ